MGMVAVEPERRRQIREMFRGSTDRTWEEGQGGEQDGLSIRPLSQLMGGVGVMVTFNLVILC